MIWFVQIYKNLYTYVLNLFEKMLTAWLAHTAAPQESRTLPHALPGSHTLPRILPHTVMPYTVVRSAADCMNIQLPHTARGTPQLT
jgi:hypothetical protein